MEIQAGRPKERQDSDNKVPVLRLLRRFSARSLQCVHKVLDPVHEKFDAKKSSEGEVRAAAREKKIGPAPAISMQRRSMPEFN
jgi:hypothetical protein